MRTIAALRKRFRIWARPLRSKLAIARARMGPRSSAIPHRLLQGIQESIFFYHYRGVPCVKNPFDLALYQMLLSELRPSLIIEIGSYEGGSAIWLASQIRGLELDCHVYSFDINKVTNAKDSLVTFEEGDIYNLHASALPKILQGHDGRILVIEDGPHTYEGCLAALEFFDSFLKKDDYIVIEDGIVEHFGKLTYSNGPNRAVRKFLATRSDSYEVDYRLCDFFGRNVTWNTDGYLKKVA